MAAYRRVYDLRHLQALTAKNRDHLRNTTLGNRVWATFTFILVNINLYQSISNAMVDLVARGRLYLILTHAVGTLVMDEFPIAETTKVINNVTVTKYL